MNALGPLHGSTIVMAGLDPAIPVAPWPPASTRNLHGQGTRNRVDARLKPGHDGCCDRPRIEAVHTVSDGDIMLTAAGSAVP
jgi:hypothetical protein